MPDSKKAPKMRIVPRLVLRVAAAGAGVIPVCVLGAVASLAPGCGNSESLTVAERCFDGGPVGSPPCAIVEGGADDERQEAAGVADAAFADVEPDHDGAVPPDVLGVADIGFADVKPDHEDGGHRDAMMGVADVGFADVEHDAHHKD